MGGEGFAPGVRTRQTSFVPGRLQGTSRTANSCTCIVALPAFVHAAEWRKKSDSSIRNVHLLPRRSHDVCGSYECCAWGLTTTLTFYPPPSTLIYAAPAPLSVFPLSTHLAVRRYLIYSTECSENLSEPVREP